MKHSVYDSRHKHVTLSHFTVNIKQFLCEISIKYNISGLLSQLAFQTTCSLFYSHEYYMKRAELFENELKLAMFRAFLSEENRKKSTKTKYFQVVL